MLSSSDSLKAYMQSIAKIGLITREEEVELAELIKNGDDDARKKLTTANLRLVVKIAHDFKGLGLSLNDLVAEGNVGLMHAVEKFDPNKGAKFSSYSSWWIKKGIRQALANQGRVIRIPVQSSTRISKIFAAKIKLSEQLGREPTNLEISLRVGFTERSVASLIVSNVVVSSLHAPVNQGEQGEFINLIPDQTVEAPDDLLNKSESITRLMKFYKRLGERERLVLKLRYGLGGGREKTLEEVSKAIGRTRERVRQIQNQALVKLKSFLKKEDEYHDILEVS